MCTKQPLLEPTRPITFKQVSAGFVCDSGRPRFRLWESPPSASWRGQMVRLVQTGSGSLGLKMNQWFNYRKREKQESAAERSERGRVLRVPGCRTWSSDCSLAFCIMKWNIRCLSEAQLWQSFGLEPKRRWWHPISHFLAPLFSDSTRPFVFFFFLLSVLWRKASAWHCYYVRLYPEHPRNAQAESPLKYLCLTDRRRLLACWWMLGPRVTDTCLMIRQLLLRWMNGEVIRQADFFFGGGEETQRQMVGGSDASWTSLTAAVISVVAGQFICWGWWAFGGRSVILHPSSGGGDLPNFLWSTFAVLFLKPQLVLVWLRTSLFLVVVLCGITVKPETLHPLPLRRPCLHRAARKPNWLCTVNFVISLVSK